MLNKSLLACAALLVCGAATAQAVLGTASEVEGLVTVSDGASVSTVRLGNPVIHGSRYVTSSSGSVVLRLENCDVHLKPNQSLVVDRQKVCAELWASIENLATERLAGLVGTNSGGATGGLGTFGAAVIGGAALLATGSRGGTSGAAPGGAGINLPNLPVSAQ